MTPRPRMEIEWNGWRFCTLFGCGSHSIRLWAQNDTSKPLPAAESVPPRPAFFITRPPAERFLSVLKARSADGVIRVKNRDNGSSFMSIDQLVDQIAEHGPHDLRDFHFRSQVGTTIEGDVLVPIDRLNYLLGFLDGRMYHHAARKSTADPIQLTDRHMEILHRAYMDDHFLWASSQNIAITPDTMSRAST